MAPQTTGDYIVQGTIARTSSAKIKLARHKRTDALVAIKVVNRHHENPRDAANVEREIAALKSIKHRNVVRLECVLASKRHIYIITEYAAGGDLLSHIPRDGCGENVAKYFFRQIVEGIRAVHNEGIAHRDLKPDNILLDASRRVVKIADFGLSARMRGDKDLLQTACGTPYYVAPEVITHQGYSGFAADTWSCGIILFMMLTGHVPFRGRTFSELYSAILTANPCWDGSNVSVGARRLVRRLLDPQASSRITLSEVTRHPWMADISTPRSRMPSAARLDDIEFLSASSQASFSTTRELAPTAALYAMDVDARAPEPVVGPPPINPEIIAQDLSLNVAIPALPTRNR